MLGREMPERQRTFTAEHAVAATPWDVFDLLVDPEQQAQWRERFEPHARVAEDVPYTRVRFEDGLTVELRPEGDGTLLRATLVRSGGAVGLALQSRKRAEEALRTQLKRIGSSVEFGRL
jgi:hypothetical protein